MTRTIRGYTHLVPILRSKRRVLTIFFAGFLTDLHHLECKRRLFKLVRPRTLGLPGEAGIFDYITIFVDLVNRMRIFTLTITPNSSTL